MKAMKRASPPISTVTDPAAVCSEETRTRVVVKDHQTTEPRTEVTVEERPAATNAHDVQFAPGVRFKFGELNVELTHCLSLDRVVITDVVTREARVVSRAELTPVEYGAGGDARRPIQFDGVSEEQLAQAVTREQALRPYFQAGTLPTRDAYQLAKALSVSTRTLWRWMHRYKHCGDVTAFLDAPRGLRQGQRSLDREVEAIIRFTIVGKLKSTGNCTVRAVYEAIRGDCQALGRSAPARSTLLERIKSLKADPEVLPPEVGRKVRDRTRLIRGSAEATRALQRVEIDHTLVDTHIVDALDGQPLGRPWLTLAIDVATRAIMGFVLTLEHPSRLSVAQCVRHSIFPKEAWLQSIGAVGPWPVFGRMKLIYTDNGAEFRSLSFRLGCKRHGIENNYRPVRTPRYGGTIERLIGTFMHRMRLIPGNTYNEILAAKTPYPAQQAVLTLDDLERWFSNEVTAYHHEPHRTLGVSPLTAWENAWRTTDGLVLPSYPADRHTLFIDLLPHESRVISTEGIYLYGLRYHCLELAPYVQPEVRRTVRFDPRDISSVFLERPEGGHVRVPWINHGWPRLSLWEWKEICARDHRRGKTGHPEVVRQCLAENDRLINERAAQGKLRARRRRARAAYWVADAQNQDPEAPSPRSRQRKLTAHPTLGSTYPAPEAVEQPPRLPRTQLEVTIASVESAVDFEVLE